MLHGWQRSLKDLLPFAELLQNHSTIHLIDLPGFGESPIPDQDWDTSEYAKRILQYLDEKKLPKVDICGHSFGGRVAARLASAFPSRIRSLTLLATPGLPIKHKLSRQLRLLWIKILSRATKLIDRYFGSNFFQRQIAPRYGSRDYLQAGPLRNILVKTVNEDLTEDAAKIQAPTLLLWGDCDAEAPLEIGIKYSQLIPRANLIVLPNRGHDCYRDVDGHLCAFYLGQFLRKLEK